MQNAPVLPSKDILETLVAGAAYDPAHARLVELLRSKTVLDTAEYATNREGFSWSRPHCLVVDEAGNSLGALRDWLPGQVAAAGGDFVAIWQVLKGGPLRLVNAHIDRLVFVAPYGEAPEQFVQVDVSLERPYIERRLFSGSPYDRPERVEDLLEDNGTYEDTRLADGGIPWGHPRYILDGVIDIATILKTVDELDAKQKARNEHMVIEKTRDDGAVSRTPYYDEYPALRTLPPRERRLFADWQRSSAGQGGARFCDHWFIDHSDYTWPDGRRAVTMIPQWVTQKALPQLARKRDMTVYALYDLLLRFDQKAGYPFAWFFFMLHGNRINDWAGEMMAQGVAGGAVGLPAHDRQVLMAWNQHRYGF